MGADGRARLSGRDGTGDREPRTTRRGGAELQALREAVAREGSDWELKSVARPHRHVRSAKAPRVSTTRYGSAGSCRGPCMVYPHACRVGGQYWRRSTLTRSGTCCGERCRRLRGGASPRPPRGYLPSPRVPARAVACSRDYFDTRRAAREFLRSVRAAPAASPKRPRKRKLSHKQKGSAKPRRNAAVAAAIAISDDVAGPFGPNGGPRKLQALPSRRPRQDSPRRKPRSR